MERPIIKLRRKGKKPIPSGIDEYINTCPACGDEEKENRKTDDMHAEVQCTICGYIIADITDQQHFLMLLNKDF